MPFLLVDIAVNCVDVHFKFQMTPLHLAANGGFVDIVKCLVEKNAVIVNVQDSYGVGNIIALLMCNKFYRMIHTIMEVEFSLVESNTLLENVTTAFLIGLASVSGLNVVY